MLFIYYIFQVFGNHFSPYYFFLYWIGYPFSITFFPHDIPSFPSKSTTLYIYVIYYFFRLLAIISPLKFWFIIIDFLPLLNLLLFLHQTNIFYTWYCFFSHWFHYYIYFIFFSSYLFILCNLSYLFILSYSSYLFYLYFSYHLSFFFPGSSRPMWQELRYPRGWACQLPHHSHRGKCSCIDYLYAHLYTVGGWCTTLPKDVGLILTIAALLALSGVQGDPPPPQWHTPTFNSYQFSIF